MTIVVEGYRVTDSSQLLWLETLQSVVFDEAYCFLTTWSILELSSICFTSFHDRRYTPTVLFIPHCFLLQRANEERGPSYPAP